MWQLITCDTGSFWQHPTTNDNNKQNQLMENINPVTIILQKWNIVRNLKNVLRNYSKYMLCNNTGVLLIFSKYMSCNNLDYQKSQIQIFFDSTLPWFLMRRILYFSRWWNEFYCITRKEVLKIRLVRFWIFWNVAEKIN